MNYLSRISIQLQEKYFDNLISLNDEIKGEVDVFLNLIELTRKNLFESSFGRALLFSNCLFMCTTIEKIIRNVALKEIQKEIYFDMNKATLANFFRSPFKLKDISGGLKYCLEFYLIKEVDFNGEEMKRPGLNIRKNIMHGKNDAYEQTDYFTFLTLFYFLVSLLNDLFITMKE